MYKVTKRDCPMFGIGPYVCEFICDTASDISTLPTSISEGTGGKSAYDNQKCASGSIANVAENGAESKQYMLNNQDIWCPYSVASGSSDSVLEEAKAYTDSEIADIINGAPTTRDTLKEIADAMAENQTVVEALDAAIGTKANKTDIPTKTSELENDSGFLTEHQDLSEYAKTADLNTIVSSINTTLGTKANKTDIPAKTSELENDSGYLTEHQDLSAYAKTSEVNTIVSSINTTLGTKANKTDIPAKTSELENDSGYLTEHQDLSAYAKTSEVNTVVSSINTTLGTKANKTDIPTKVSQLENDSGYLTEHQDLSAYAKTSEVNTVVSGINTTLGTKANKTDIPTKVSQLENDSGYLTEHQDLSEYAKKTEVPSIKVNSAVNADTVNGHTVNVDVPADAKFTDTVPDLSLYALKSKYGDDTIDVGRKADTTIGMYSTAEGYNTTASGIVSHAEGQSTTASEDCAHAEGWKTTASGKWSHAEGQDTTASGIYSHAEGFGTAASGNCSHAEGYETTASGIGSHASGIGTQALHRNEAAYGTFNESNDDTLFSVGDGTADDARHNAFEITTSGGKLHDKDIFTSAHCIQFIPYNMKYYALNDRLLLFANDDTVTRGIYFVNNTSNDIVVCALISASAEGPIVQYGYGTSTYPDIQNIGGDGRQWFVGASIPTSPTIYSMTVPSGKLGYYGVYQNSESAYATVHDIRCPYFNYF